MCVSCRDHSSYAPRSLQYPLAVYRLCDLFRSTFSFSPLSVRRSGSACGQAVALRNPRRRSVGLLIRVIAVRRPELREVPAEVQFEVARNPVTDIADLCTARLRTGQGQQWEEQVDARLDLDGCRHPEPIDLSLRRG